MVIVTYMRSGSSLLGDILRQSNDALYVFEPVHVLGTPMMVNKTVEKNLVYVNGTIRYRIIPRLRVCVCVCTCVRACVCACVCRGGGCKFRLNLFNNRNVVFEIIVLTTHDIHVHVYSESNTYSKGWRCRGAVNNRLALKIRSHMFDPRLLQFVG